MRTNIPAALMLALLSGCASFSPDGGLDSVNALTRARTGHALERDQPAEVIRASMTQILGAPLNPDSAVRLALLNNAGLRAALQDLGMAEADLVQAGRLRNPGFSFGRMRGGDSVEIERSVMFDLVGLLTLPVRSGIEQGRFEQAKLAAAAQVVQLAADTRKAYFSAVAAQQTVAYMEQVATAAEAGAELARRMARAGNWSRLEQMREQVFYAEATAQVARARHQAAAERERLTRLLGLPGDGQMFTLPARLPDLPEQADARAGSETLALSQRLDIQLARRNAEASAKALGLSKATGFLNVHDLGYQNKSQTGEPRENGYEISLELPIFDWSQARTARAEAVYMQAVHRTADITVRARSEVRQAYSAYRTAYDLARHQRDEVVPLRKKISEEVLLRYNGMLIGVFELLADAREQIHSVNAAIDTQRDYWLAETDLHAAINGSGGAAIELRGGTPAAASPEH